MKRAVSEVGTRLTLAIFKPDVQRVPPYRELASELIEETGLRFALSTEVHLTRERAEKFYQEHIGKFFHDRLVNSMLSGPIGVHLLEGDDAIKRWRAMLGPAKVYQSVVRHPELLRAKFGLTDSRNGFHGSDSPESMMKEAEFFFSPLQLQQVISSILSSINQYSD